MKPATPVIHVAHTFVTTAAEVSRDNLMESDGVKSNGYGDRHGTHVQLYFTRKSAWQSRLEH